jgi:uncharacterized protein
MEIPDKVKTLFDKTNLVPFGTASITGNPNINVVFWKKISDHETILLIDNYMKTAKQNLAENNQVCLSFWDPETEEGYKIKGTAVYHQTGEIYEEGKKFIQSVKPDRIPKGVVEIIIQEIYILSPGPDAGKRLV